MELAGLGSWWWVGAVVGAVIGGVVVLKIFDWGLIVFSSLAGALLVERGIPMDGIASVVLFATAFAVGVALQGTQLGRARARKERERERQLEKGRE